jgi:hypothetical protein
MLRWDVSSAALSHQEALCIACSSGLEGHQLFDTYRGHLSSLSDNILAHKTYCTTLLVYRGPYEIHAVASQAPLSQLSSYYIRSHYVVSVPSCRCPPPCRHCFLSA